MIKNLKIEETKNSITLRDEDGDIVASVNRFATSTSAMTISEVMDGVGFKGDEKDWAIECNKEQMEYMRLFACAPKMAILLRTILQDINIMHKNGHPYLQNVENEIKAVMSQL